MKASARTTFLLMTLLAWSIAYPSPSLASEDGPGIRGEHVFVGRYYEVPGKGIWAAIDVGIPNHPLEYTYELKCFDEGVGDILCLNENERLCPGAPGGRLVYWMSRLKGSDGPWQRVGSDATCIYSEKPRDIVDQIEELILSEFQSRPILSGLMGMQPTPYTLVNYNTNFYVNSVEQTFDFEMFQQDIRIVARPTEFEWNYGDGTSYGPVPYAGASLPRDQWGEETTTSHVYLETGEYQASVTVYFSAEYSINGGPFVPIDGRATVPSAPQTISVWKSESHSVADNCLENPMGIGC